MTAFFARILLVLCIGLVGTAEESKRDTEKAKSKPKAEQRENSVETAGKAVGQVGKDTGEAVAEGSKKAADATVKGTKWLVRPWSKSKDTTKQKESTKPPSEKKN